MAHAFCNICIEIRKNGSLEFKSIHKSYAFEQKWLIIEFSTLITAATLSELMATQTKISVSFLLYDPSQVCHVNLWYLHNFFPRESVEPFIRESVGPFITAEWIVSQIIGSGGSTTGADCIEFKTLISNYRQVSNIRRTFVGNKICDHSDVVEASPVGAASTTSSFST